MLRIGWIRWGGFEFLGQRVSQSESLSFTKFFINLRETP